MPPSKRLPELYGAHEAALLLGVKKSNLRKVSGLPKAQELASGPVFRASEIRALARKRDRERIRREENGR